MFLLKRQEKYSHIWKDSRAFEPIFTGTELIKTVKTRKITPKDFHDDDEKNFYLFTSISFRSDDEGFPIKTSTKSCDCTTVIDIINEF